MAIASGIIGAGGIGTIFLLATYPEPNGTNHEIQEYTNLHKSARRADAFMNNHYRNHFIKKALAAI